MYTVYIHVCPNGKRYVGQTAKKPEYRWGKNGYGYKEHNQHFWNAIQKYGWENIQHLILATELTKEQADSLEIETIKKYKTNNREFGYNKSTGGEYSLAGVPFTEEHKKKISMALTGIKRDASSYSGRHLSEETKDKIRQAHLGKKLSKEHKEKIGKSNLGKKCPKTREFILKNCGCIEVYQYDMSMNPIATYYSLSEASRQASISQSKLSSLLKSGEHLSKGYYWYFGKKQEQAV